MPPKAAAFRPAAPRRCPCSLLCLPHARQHPPHRRRPQPAAVRRLLPRLHLVPPALVTRGARIAHPVQRPLRTDRPAHRQRHRPVSGLCRPLAEHVLPLAKERAQAGSRRHRGEGEEGEGCQGGMGGRKGKLRGPQRPEGDRGGYRRRGWTYCQGTVQCGHHDEYVPTRCQGWTKADYFGRHDAYYQVSSRQCRRDGRSPFRRQAA